MVQNVNWIYLYAFICVNAEKHIPTSSGYKRFKSIVYTDQAILCKISFASITVMALDLQPKDTVPHLYTHHQTCIIKENCQTRQTAVLN